MRASRASSPGRSHAMARGTALALYSRAFPSLATRKSWFPGVMQAQAGMARPVPVQELERPPR